MARASTAASVLLLIVGVSLFLSVMLDCEVDEQVRRIDNPDRIARLKGSDPEGYRWHRHHTKLFQPPPGDVVLVDTTKISARTNAETIYEMLLSRGLRRPARRPATS